MLSKHRITATLSPEEHDSSASLSVKSRVSQAWIVRQALVEFLGRHEDDQMQLPFELARAVQSGVRPAQPRTQSLSAERRAV